MLYFALKSLHILAVALFLGNIITGLFWKSHADRTGDPRIMAHTLDGIIRSDRWFTIPGVVLIILFGVGAAMAGKLSILGTSWIRQSIELFIISGLAFMMQVAPLQKLLRQIALSASADAPFDQELYRRLSRRWELWGLLAIAAPLAALVLMVVKPGS